MLSTRRNERIENALSRLSTCQDALQMKQRDLLIAIVRGEDQRPLQEEVDRLSACVMQSLDDLEDVFKA